MKVSVVTSAVWASAWYPSAIVGAFHFPSHPTGARSIPTASKSALFSTVARQKRVSSLVDWSDSNEIK